MRPIDHALGLAAARGWSQSEFARRLDVAPANVTNWKVRDLPADQYVRVAHLLGVSVDELVHGQLQGASAITGVEEKTGSFGALQPILSWEHEEDLPAGDYVFIPRLDVKLSAGHGKEQVELEFVKTQPQAFRADWVREQRLKPKYLVCATAVGDSMVPTIWDGDSLVIDTNDRDVVDGRVYWLWYEGGERAKRLFRLPGGGLRINSDNSEYPPMELQPSYLGHIRIIGRIVHRSGKGGL